MREDGVQATFHYVPLHSSDAGRRFSARATECPVSDDVSGRLLRLPFSNNLTPDDIARVVASLTGALSRVGTR
jgi:dTDP-4-amino-4,6-dideoxygalactose transaminase